MALIRSSLLLSAAPIPSSKCHLCTTSSHLITCSSLLLPARGGGGGGGAAAAAAVDDACRQVHPLKLLPRRVAVLGSGYALGAAAVAVLLAGGFVMVPPVADAKEDDHPIRPKFVELEDSGGVKVLDIREGGGATYPKPGDRVGAWVLGVFFCLIE